ncbi:MAG: hydantoinase B/oxoprolinase family protein, partial [Caldilineaceae bacterium]|nr:hydantoinase B/oxoprolinase family protein [Caldilineaceae bacterium]
AFGLFGGHDAITSEIYITRDGRRGPCTCQAAGLPLQVGDLITVNAGGGGGYGDPSLRDPALLQRDITLGYISPERAREVYGFEHVN